MNAGTVKAGMAVDMSVKVKPMSPALTMVTPAMLRSPSPLLLMLTDWTAEREWRHVGDVPLDEIPPDAALLFVPTETEAEQLATISRWPVVVVPR